jgi:hypothetical protein
VNGDVVFLLADSLLSRFKLEPFIFPILPRPSGIPARA